MNSTDQRLETIFRTVFELPESVNVRQCAAGSTTAWDSMGHVMLVVAIEEEFGVTIDAADSLTLKTYDSTRQYLAALGA